MKECVFEKSIDRWVYSPPGWGDDVKCPYPFKMAAGEFSFCKHCFLRPCFVVGKAFEMTEFVEEHRFFAPHEEDRSNDVVNFKLLDHVHALMVEVFGAGYTQKEGLPLCVLADIQERYPVLDHHPDDHSDWEDLDDERSSRRPLPADDVPCPSDDEE